MAITHHDLDPCPSCGQAHEKLAVHEFERGGEFWAHCPTYNEPFIMLLNPLTGNVTKRTAPTQLPPSARPVAALPPRPLPVGALDCHLCGSSLDQADPSGESVQLPLYVQLRYELPDAIGRHPGHYRRFFHHGCYFGAASRLEAMLRAAGSVNMGILTGSVAALVASTQPPADVGTNQ